MEIFYDNRINEIKNVIEIKAKYQKVMLLYDENVSNCLKGDIYNEIKELCIYNEMDINNINEQEIFNGYKAIIYLCFTNSFLKCSFNRSEFVNLYCPLDEFLLPYFISSDNKIAVGNNFLFLQSMNVDSLMIVSIYFNRFFNYLNELIMNGNRELDFGLEEKEITIYNMIESLQRFNDNSSFVDLDVIKKTGIAYEDVAVVDLMLINSFYVLITSIKNNSVMLVDSYKGAKDDYELLDKIYKIYNDETFKNMVTLNYNFLYNFLNKTKQNILELINIVDFNVQDIDNKIKKLKSYAKESNNLISYLYVYNIFNE